MRGLLLLLGLCGPWAGAGETPGVEVLRIGGAGTGLGGMERLGKAFSRSHPGIQVQIMPSLGSSGGIKAMLNGALDLAIAARPLEPAEIQAGAQAREYARTPLVLVANREVQAGSMTLADLEAIYRGTLSRWPDGSRIRMILRPVSDTDTRLVRGLGEGMAKALEAAHARPGMLLAITDQEALQDIGRIPGAIGWSSLAQLAVEAQPVKVLALDGRAGTLKALAEGRYPVVKRLSLVTGAQPPGRVQAFLVFLDSPAAQAELRGLGFLVGAGDRGER